MTDIQAKGDFSESMGLHDDKRMQQIFWVLCVFQTVSSLLEFEIAFKLSD